MKNITVFAALFLFTATASFAQSLDELYTNWARENIPVSHANIKAMVEKVYGEDERKTKPIIELHCKALNKILTDVQSGNIDINLLAQALEKWTQSKPEQRVEQWWEWPDTNWMRVETEYKALSGK